MKIILFLELSRGINFRAISLGARGQRCLRVPVCRVSEVTGPRLRVRQCDAPDHGTDIGVRSQAGAVTCLRDACGCETCRCGGGRDVRLTHRQHHPGRQPSITREYSPGHHTTTRGPPRRDAITTRPSRSERVGHRCVSPRPHHAPRERVFAERAIFAAVSCMPLMRGRVSKGHFRGGRTGSGFSMGGGGEKQGGWDLRGRGVGCRALWGEPVRARGAASRRGGSDGGQRTGQCAGAGFTYGGLAPDPR